MSALRWVPLVATLLATPALAEERDYCPTRPGLGTTPCTIAPGHLSVETALADWTQEDDADTRTDTVLIGDTQARLGVTDALELQLGWTPYGRQRMRDKATGMVERQGRVGDVTLGLKANLLHPDGKGVSIAVQPFVTVPAGRQPVGAGDWGAGVLMPATFDLSKTLTLQTTTEVDAAVNEDGRGRHFTYSEVLGLGVGVTETFNATLEAEMLRDHDPAGHSTQALASASLAWMPRKTLQFDIGAVCGLNRSSPDVELYVGVSRRF